MRNKIATNISSKILHNKNGTLNIEITLNILTLITLNIKISG